jgi:hypothetical protein
MAGKAGNFLTTPFDSLLMLCVPLLMLAIKQECSKPVIPLWRDASKWRAD